MAYVNRRNRKGLAIVAAFLFLMGVVVPAAFGWLTVKAMDLGMAEPLESLTGIAQKYGVAPALRSGSDWNSSYFISVDPQYYDNATQKYYEFRPVYDSDQGLLLVMPDTSDAIASSAISISKWDIPIYIRFNKTALADVDKVVFFFKIVDNAGKNLAGAGTVYISTDGNIVKQYSVNMTEAQNHTVKVEFDIDAITRLKIQSADIVKLAFHYSIDQPLDGIVYGFDVGLFNVRKVNASAAANIMLASSGILGWIGALAATPYWNPMSNPNHRNVRGAVRRVRRIRRR